MQIIEAPVLGALFQVTESLRLLVKILGLVDNLKANLFHPDEILPAEFPVVAHLANAEPSLAHVHKPPHHIGVVYRGAVTQGKPSIVRPAKQRDVVLVRFDVGRHHREERVSYHNVNSLVVAKEASRC